MLDILNEWWENRKLPDEAKITKVVSLYKKGSPDKQEKYRPISLLNTFYKIIAAVIQRRLASALDNKLMKTQYGFRKIKSTIAAVFIARRIQELAERKGSSNMMLLLDWEKAFDKVEHEWLYTTLANMCVPGQMLDIIKDMYKDPKSM